MKTIAFEFRFTKEPPWNCEIWQGNEMFFGKIAFLPPSKPFKKSSPLIQSPPIRKKQPTDDGWLNYLAALYPRHFKRQPNRPTCKTFQEFFQQSIEDQQNVALDIASLTGTIRAPTNYVAEFWTADYIQKLARALSRPRKAQELRLKVWLLNNWVNAKLQSMTRHELARVANRNLGTSFKEAKVWQTAYRSLELYTTRKPGPPVGK